MKRSLVLLAPALVFALACSKKSNDQAGAKSDDTKAAATKEPVKAANKPLDESFFGKTVAPPGALGPIKPGSSKEEAQKAVPDLDKIPMAETGYEGVSYAYQDLTEGSIPGVHLPKGSDAVIEKAWGPGIKTDRGGTPVVVWFNPEQGIRASYSAQGDRAYLRFEPYMPVAKLLGEGKGLPLLDKPFEGKTEEELKTMYPSLVTKIGHLGFPATEWEFGGNINLSPYPMNKPIKSLAFSIPFKTPEQQAEIMKLIEAKWGKAGAEVPFGSLNGEKTWVYNKKDPHIEVTEPGGYNKNAITIRIGGNGK